MGQVVAQGGKRAAVAVARRAVCAVVCCGVAAQKWAARCSSYLEGMAVAL